MWCLHHWHSCSLSGYVRLGVGCCLCSVLHVQWSRWQMMYLPLSGGSARLRIHCASDNRLLFVMAGGEVEPFGGKV
jgi:hypothetical protein